MELAIIWESHALSMLHAVVVSTATGSEPTSVQRIFRQKSPQTSIVWMSRSIESHARATVANSELASMKTS